jgi:DNA-binding XRE family transcriptional regulator
MWALPLITQDTSPVDSALYDLGLPIAQTRKRRGWTQVHLANEIDANLHTVRRVAAGAPGAESPTWYLRTSAWTLLRRQTLPTRQFIARVFVKPPVLDQRRRGVCELNKRTRAQQVGKNRDATA